MSLYFFGRFKSDDAASQNIRSNLLSLAASARVHVSWSIDIDDESALNGVEEFRNSSGTYYRITSSRETDDATDLWVEAQSRAVRIAGIEARNRFLKSVSRGDPTPALPEYFSEMKETRLGRVLDGIVNLPDCAVGSAALVEGGIDEVRRRSKGDCLALVLMSCHLPWDVLPQVLYVWRC